MGKKKVIKKPKSKNLPGQARKELPETKEPDKDSTFDFGGLPDRNLKKNLGCG